VGKRAYQSALRDESARRTKRVVADAAMTLFLEHGYADTSVAAVARAAGVSTQTVYNTFGTKADLLKHLYDITLVGDDEPVPLAQRPEFVELMARTDARDFLTGYAAIGLVLLRRLGPLMGVIRAGAAAGSADLQDHLARTDAERLVGATMTARHAAELGGRRAGVDEEQARDAIWTLNSVEVWELLTRSRGWSDDRYVSWVGRAMADAVLPPA
jgi:AcrR family transcriptional regulator